LNSANIIQITHPATGEKTDIRIEEDYCRHLYKNIRTSYENLRAAKYVLENPKRIFSGILRSVTSDGQCFVGKPERWYINPTDTAPFPKNKVFLVFLTTRMQLYNFRAELSDLEDPLSPIDWKNRFGGVLWKSTS